MTIGWHQEASRTEVRSTARFFQLKCVCTAEPHLGGPGTQSGPGPPAPRCMRHASSRPCQQSKPTTLCNLPNAAPRSTRQQGSCQQLIMPPRLLGWWSVRWSGLLLVLAALQAPTSQLTAAKPVGRPQHQSQRPAAGADAVGQSVAFFKEAPRACPAGCEEWGNCNQETGVCDCPFGYTGE